MHIILFRHERTVLRGPISVGKHKPPSPLDCVLLTFLRRKPDHSNPSEEWLPWILSAQAPQLHHISPSGPIRVGRQRMGLLFSAGHANLCPPDANGSGTYSRWTSRGWHILGLGEWMLYRSSVISPRVLRIFCRRPVRVATDRPRLGFTVV